MPLPTAQNSNSPVVHTSSTGGSRPSQTGTSERGIRKRVVSFVFISPPGAIIGLTVPPGTRRTLLWMYNDQLSFEAIGKHPVEDFRLLRMIFAVNEDGFGCHLVHKTESPMGGDIAKREGRQGALL